MVDWGKQTKSLNGFIPQIIDLQLLILSKPQVIWTVFSSIINLS